jgi:uridine monophosphate synthetase
VPDNIPVLLDNKRGDIGSTAVAYAESAYDQYKADAVTVNPYMGTDSVSPFTSNATKGCFVLCKTSNPSSKDMQELKLDSGEALFERTARLAAEQWNGNNNVGLVVGATDIDALERTRKAAPNLWILAPGIGSQGGDLVQATRKGLRADGLGLLVPVSRGIARADDPKHAAEQLRMELNSAREIAIKETTEGEGEKKDNTIELKPFQTKFIQFALDATVLRFGEFTLKSGRVSPYFFNAGLFNSGKLLVEVGEAYASALLERSELEYDLLFGPAYKGITLVSAVSMMLAKRGVNKHFAYNRKVSKLV